MCFGGTRKAAEVDRHVACRPSGDTCELADVGPHVSSRFLNASCTCEEATDSRHATSCLFGGTCGVTEVDDVDDDVGSESVEGLEVGATADAIDVGTVSMLTALLMTTPSP